MVSVGANELFLFAAFAYLACEWITLSWYKESIYHRLFAAGGIIGGSLLAARLTPVEALPYAAYGIVYIRFVMLGAQIVYMLGRRMVLRRYAQRVIRRSQLHAVHADIDGPERSQLELGGHRTYQYGPPPSSGYPERGGQ